MNDDIIRMAAEAGIKFDPRWGTCYTGNAQLTHFANLVRAAEQDRCCRIIFGMAGSDNVAQRTVDAIRSKE